jgi:hypothetical protein
MIASPKPMRLLLLTLVAVGAGCAGRAGHIAAGVPTLDVPYSKRADTVGAAARRTPADDAAQALGLPALATVLLPEGARELRMSDWYGMIAGTAVPVLRIVEQAGRPAVGQWLWVWPERREWSLRRRAARCSPWTDGARTCASGPTGPPVDWLAVAAQFDRLGVWALSEGCETDGMHVTDSGALLIQRLAGAEFGTYECNTPSRRDGSAAGRAALAVYRYFMTLARQAGEPPPA